MSIDKHNNRKYKTDLKTDLNVRLIGSANLTNDVKEIYQKEFSESLKKYNAKQKECRKIRDYFDHVSNSRNDLACEIILQVGDMDFWQDKSIEEKQKILPIFNEQIKRLQQLAPTFKIASVIAHFDESSPHLHIVGVPIKENCKNGLNKQCVKTAVFTKESLEFLHNEMRKELEIEIQKIYGNQVYLQEKGEGRNYDYTKEEYIKIQNKLKAQALENLREETKKFIFKNKYEEPKIKEYEINKTLKEIDETKGGIFDKHKEKYEKLRDFTETLSSQALELQEENKSIKEEMEQYEQKKDFLFRDLMQENAMLKKELKLEKKKNNKINEMLDFLEKNKLISLPVKEKLQVLVNGIFEKTKKTGHRDKFKRLD